MGLWDVGDRWRLRHLLLFSICRHKATEEHNVIDDAIAGYTVFSIVRPHHLIDRGSWHYVVPIQHCVGFPRRSLKTRCPKITYAKLCVLFSSLPSPAAPYIGASMFRNSYFLKTSLSGGIWLTLIQNRYDSLHVRYVCIRSVSYTLQFLCLPCMWVRYCSIHVCFAIVLFVRLCVRYCSVCVRYRCVFAFDIVRYPTDPHLQWPLQRLLNDNEPLLDDISKNPGTYHCLEADTKV